MLWIHNCRLTSGRHYMTYIMRSNILLWYQLSSSRRIWNSCRRRGRTQVSGKQKRQVRSGTSLTLHLYFCLFTTFIEKDALWHRPGQPVVNQFNDVRVPWPLNQTSLILCVYVCVCVCVWEDPFATINSLKFAILWTCLDTTVRESINTNRIIKWKCRELALLQLCDSCSMFCWRSIRTRPKYISRGLVLWQPLYIHTT